jgi:hypothetical protein
MTSDNAMISVYPFGDELYALTEYPVIHRFDPVTLDTLDKVSECVHSQSCKTNANTRGHTDRLCGLVVRVLGYRSGGPGSIPGTTKKN